MTVHCNDEGSGLPIVWIHGFPLSSEVFAAQRSIAGVRHILPDLPGFGASAPPDGETSIDDYARDVLGLLDGRGIDRAVVAGVSMGGYVAMAIHRIAPERVLGLILIDTRETADTDDARQQRFRTIDDVRSNGTRSLVDSMLPKMFTPETIASKPLLTERLRDIMLTASEEGVIAALRAMAERPDSSGVLAAVRVPSLVVCGEADPITPPADAERMASQLGNDASLAIIGSAAHLSMMEQPEAFNAAVADYLSRLERE